MVMNTQYFKEYYQKNKEKRLAQSKKRYAGKREEIIEKVTAYRLANKDEINTRRRELRKLKKLAQPPKEKKEHKPYIRNKERDKETHKLWQERNREKTRAYNRAYRERLKTL